MNKNLILIFFILINFTAINFTKCEWQDYKKCLPSAAMGSVTLACTSDQYCDISSETRVIDGQLYGQCRTQSPR